MFELLKQIASRIVGSKGFQRLVIMAIVLSAVLVGLETSPAILAKWGEGLKRMDRLLVLLFAVEIFMRLLSYGRGVGRFFSDPWNVFDFAVVSACLMPASPQYLVVLRLFRILRVLRLVTTIPKLQLLVGALFKSIPSMGYVVILLAVHFYIYAVLGTFLFATNDVSHFGSLGSSALTLFQVVTLEGWVEVMAAQQTAFPFIAPLYFISFIVFGTMIILNLFIGVVVNSMTEMQEELEAQDTPVTSKTIQAEITALRSSVDKLEKHLSRLEQGPSKAS